MRPLVLLLGAMLPTLALAGDRVRISAADLGSGPQPLSMMALLGGMALLPLAVMMVSSFAKIAVVLSIGRSALGTQQAPPTMVLTGLAVILSAHVMAPVVERMYEQGRPAFEEARGGAELLSAAALAAEPLREFLVRHGSVEERARFVELARTLRPPEEAGDVSESDLAVVLPAFVLTELKEAFQIGFLVFLPFLLLDMVIANVLLALGMQTLPPSQVSLPFKLLLFVSVDGWALLARGLILGYR